MKIKNTAILLFALLTFASGEVSAQRAQLMLDELPSIPFDTLSAENGRRIIITSNGTWRYLNEDIAELKNNKLFYNHWDTASVFAYRDFDYDKMPDELEIKVVESLKDFCVPVKGNVYSSYGRRGRSKHNGVDLPKPVGTPIYATFDGRVRYSKYNTGGYGYMVILRHPNGLESWYGHLCRLGVNSGDYVKAGQIIGYVGNTGRSYGSHLHFELRYCDQTFDPEFLIDFQNGRLKYKVFPLKKSYLDINSHASELLQEYEENFAISTLLAQADDSVAIRAALAQQADIESSQTGRETLRSEQAVYHVVKSGDILGRIAIRYGTTIDKICKMNNISRNSILRLGQRLRVK